MKTLLTILTTFVLLSCNKQNTTAMADTQAMPLKAVPTATVNGKTITFDASKSTGPITQYGWALDVTSPTDGGTANPITWSPNMSHKGADFIPLYATVTKSGVYEFGLSVYSADGKEDYALVKVEVK